ncbi:MAG: 3-hydroxyacyl-CoA dehydrogenase family protein [Chloroflexota bacterium]|nr:3-hydroxyacyl-CoA dehydrogenase family protein [Chloroflexota bacterium]
MNPIRVAVLGTGMMGPGITVILALAGHRATLYGRTAESLQRGLDTIDRCLELLHREKLLTARAASAARRRIDASTDLGAAVGQATFVFESVVEDLELKQRLFAEVECLAGADTILASNTSGLPITRIAERMQHPERAATTHFWNPPHLMPLVEIVKGERTSEETIARLQRVLTEAGKRVVVVRKDLPGQLGNRLLHALFREAFHMVQDGVASVEDVDAALRYGPGLRFPAYGLLEHADMVGLDMMQSIDSYLFGALSNMDELPEFVRDLIAQGDLGAKTGHGLYDWTQRSAAEVLAGRDKFLVDRLKERLRADPSRR